MRKLVASAEIAPSDVVLEVGCGTGSLTQELAAVAHTVVAIETDEILADVAASQLAGCDNVRLIRRDVLLTKTRIEPTVVQAVVDARGQSGGDVLLVANLPYSVASPLIVDLLTGPVALARLCFTVQKEVGDRLLADPGGKDYGPLSVIVQSLGDVHRTAAVPPRAFWPPPAVDSVMLRIDPNAPRRRQIEDLSHFTDVVKTCFQHRRKTLGHILTAAYDAAAAESALSACKIKARTRPEQLAPSTWVELARCLAR